MLLPLSLSAHASTLTPSRLPSPYCHIVSCFHIIHTRPQIENEYGFCGSDKVYLRHLVDLARTHLEEDVLLFTTGQCAGRGLEEWEAFSAVDVQSYGVYVHGRVGLQPGWGREAQVAKPHSSLLQTRRARRRRAAWREMRSTREWLAQRGGTGSGLGLLGQLPGSLPAAGLAGCPASPLTPSVLLTWGSLTFIPLQKECEPPLPARPPLDRAVDFGPGWFNPEWAYSTQRRLNAPGKSPPFCSEF